MSDALVPDEVIPATSLHLPAKREIVRGKAGLRPHQLWFANSLALITVLSGGYRSGKTVGLVARAYRWGLLHYPLPVLALEPKWRMVTDVFVETALRMCSLWKLRAKWSDSRKTLEMGPVYRPSRTLFRSGDAGREAVEGVTAGSLLVDEWELIPLDVLKAAMARVSGGPPQYQTIGLAGTPEGYGPGYSLLLENPQPGTVQRTVRTADNAMHLRPGYVEETASRLSEAEAMEKLDGIRTKAGGMVYSRFQRGIHDARPCVDVHNARLEVFADFNTGLMAWPVALVDDAKRAIHIVGEIVHFDTDTVEQCERAIPWIVDFESKRGKIISRDGFSLRGFRIVCDASSDHRTGVVALSHVSVLRAKGFKPQYGKINPAVEDRVATVQNLLATGRLTIDRDRAPYTTLCLEQQGKLPNGEPSKDPKQGTWKGRPVGLDHGSDAVGYGCFWHFPTWKPAPNLEEEERRRRYVDAGYSNVR